MYIVGKIDEKKFYFVVCNTGDGVSFHPSTRADYPKEKRRCVAGQVTGRVHCTLSKP